MNDDPTKNIAVIVLEVLQGGPCSREALHTQVQNKRRGLNVFNFEGTQKLIDGLEHGGYLTCKDNLVALTKIGNQQVKLFLKSFKQQQPRKSLSA